MYACMGGLRVVHYLDKILCASKEYMDKFLCASKENISGVVLDGPAVL
jgi:hypothetical protein